MHLYMMQQATQFIGQMEQGYHMDAVLRVKNCLYAHYTGPMPESQLASYKLQVHAFENEQKDVYKRQVYTSPESSQRRMGTSSSFLCFANTLGQKQSQVAQLLM